MVHLSSYGVGDKDDDDDDDGNQLTGICRTELGAQLPL